MDNCVVNSLPHYNDSYISSGTIIIQTLWTDESIGISVYSTESDKFPTILQRSDYNLIISKMFTIKFDNQFKPIAYFDDDKNVAGKQGYSGTLLKSKLIATADALETDASDFMADIKLALCTPNGLPTFTYHLTSESFKFCKVTDAGLRITYGDVHLVERTDAIEQILLNSIKSNETKQNQIDALRTEITQLNETYDFMKSSLEKCVSEKVEMENVLLTKFAALLNAKKEKIVELEKAIKNRSSVVADDFESDGSDSDMDYSSQRSREKIPVAASSTTGNEAVVTVVPKRRNIYVRSEKAEVADVEDVSVSKPETMDIYDRDTEVMLDDM